MKTRKVYSWQLRKQEKRKSFKFLIWEIESRARSCHDEKIISQIVTFELSLEVRKCDSSPFLQFVQSNFFCHSPLNYYL
jgi:hypothetical protein